MHPTVKKIYNTFTKSPQTLFMSVFNREDLDGRKAQIPEWFYFPVFGQPRNVDIAKLRSFATIPIVNTCVTKITNGFARLEWEIVPIDKDDYSEGEIETVTDFLMKPNDNGESESDIRRKWVRDSLVTDAAVLVKVFDKKSFTAKKSFEIEMNNYSGLKKSGMIEYGKNDDRGISKSLSKVKKDRTNMVMKAFKPLKPFGSRKMTQLYCHDGSTFNVDADYTGFVHRYIQYSTRIPKKDPVFFDKEEIVYTKIYPRSYSFYGYSAIQSLEKILLTIKDQIYYFLDFFKEKGIPDGLITFEDMNEAELKRLATEWKKGTMGKSHKFGLLGRAAKFVPLMITSKDMEVLSSMESFQRLVMAHFHVNIPILSLKGTAPKAGTEALLKSDVMDGIEPYMKEWERIMNTDVIPELLQDEKPKIKFQFKIRDLDDEQIKRTLDIADANAGIKTINEIRTENGMDTVPWGDEPLTIFMPLPMGNKEEGEDE